MKKVIIFGCEQSAQLANYYLNETTTDYDVVAFTVNKEYNSGEKLGLIHFGSRVDLIIPKADVFQLYVKEGDYMSGSESMIGEFI